MGVEGIALAIAAALVVAGYAGFAWLRHGRDPIVRDDNSILLPAPPPEMTAATAAIVDGEATSLAFMAALLDLASRDEIRFHAERHDADRDLVGIEIRGTDTSDAQVLLNRRRPIGDGEAWLLTQIKESLLMQTLPAARHSAPQGGASPGATTGKNLELMPGAMQAYLQFAAFAATDAGDAEMKALREHGLFSAGVPDLDTLIRSMEIRTGRPLSPEGRASLERAGAALEIISDPAAIARDPEGAAARFEARTGQRPTPEQIAQITAWATEAAAREAHAAPSAPAYIPAPSALRLRAPMLFGTFIQQYAIRHGWLAGLPLFRRLRWRLTGIVELVVALVLLAVGSNASSDAFTGLGVGIGIGGAATWLIAPAMPTTTSQGALMRAQLAAYRRTLAATFAEAPSIDAALSKSALSWLETPDQALVWGIALGLRRDIERLLARTATDINTGRAASGAYVPVWYSSPEIAPVAGTTTLTNPAAMFAGIEAIGSER